MITAENYRSSFASDGYFITDSIYSSEEVAAIIKEIETSEVANDNFRRSAELFAIRKFLQEIPYIKPLLFSRKFKELFSELFGREHLLVKSIYFNKPAQSNWFVACHQDLSISVDKKMEQPGFYGWTIKQDTIGVIPPLSILRSMVTVRIHLDDTNEENGALHVWGGSHAEGIAASDQIKNKYEEKTCPIKAGSAMFMSPLLFHASGRTTNNKSRRVIHLEFSPLQLPGNIHWAERMNCF